MPLRSRSWERLPRPAEYKNSQKEVMAGAPFGLPEQRTQPATSGCQSELRDIRTIIRSRSMIKTCLPLASMTIWRVASDLKSAEPLATQLFRQGELARIDVKIQVKQRTYCYGTIPSGVWNGVSGGIVQLHGRRYELPLHQPVASPATAAYLFMKRTWYGVRVKA